MVSSELVAIAEKYLAHTLQLSQSSLRRDESVLRLPVSELTRSARHPEAAWSGLLLIAGCWQESHAASQDLSTGEGSYWHGIAHRIEPDSFNAGYWFRRVGTHAIFPALQQQAAAILQHGPTSWRLKSSWDPFLFIEWCDDARVTGATEKIAAAERIQQAECRLLLEFCIS